MIILPGVLVVVLATGISAATVGLVITTLIEGGMAGLIIIAAGGYGYLLIRPLAPRSTPWALRAVTACGVGLWGLSTVILAVGAGFTGAMKPWVWWPVVAGGVILAAWETRSVLETWKLPTHFDRRSLVWVVLAIAVGLWVIGATRPPGLIQTPDSYDVLEYHLQIPREFHHAQHIGQLKHNCYSYYPQGTEMLFLLGMCLRNGAYEGMYLAKMIHGAFGVVAVAAVFATLRSDNDARARFSTVLLATSPFVIYLSWIAMVELAMICYLTLSVLWMSKWGRGCGWRASICIGLMLGGACATKYLSVGLIVAPVLMGMIVLSMIRLKRASNLVYIPLTAAIAALLFSPWCIRNFALTGNPVFPLGTRVFGRGHWSGESEQRWVDGHGPQFKPPVPPPTGWVAPPRPSRLKLLYDNFISDERFGPTMMLLGCIAICVLIVSGNKGDPWDWSLVVILVIQIVVWTSLTHGMPARFLTPAIVPIALLGGGVLGRLSRVQASPFRSAASTLQSGSWGRGASVALLVGTAGVNLLIGYRMYNTYTAYIQRIHGTPGDLIARAIQKDAYELPPDSRIMLLGEAKAFYFPHETLYATAFDTHPLDPIARKLKSREMTPIQALEELRRLGVTHIWADWREILRLANSYGFPASLSAELIERHRDDLPPGLELFDKLGMCVVGEIELPQRTTAPDSDAPLPWPWVTIYALPPGIPAATSATVSVMPPASTPSERSP